MGTDRKDEPLGSFVTFGPFVTFVSFVVLAFASALLAGQQPDTPSILVSRQLAELEQIAVGDQVQLATDEKGTDARAFRVAGIYEPTPDPMRLGAVPRAVRLHLTDLLALTRDASTPAGTEHVESINVALTDPDDARAFAADVNARIPGVFARLAIGAAGAGSTFVVLERFHLAIAAVTIVAATVFLLALSIMLVDERRATVGVLRLIGFPARRILVQVLLEGLLIAGAGALFGLLLAFGSEGLINRFFQWRYNTALIFVKVTPSVAATCLAIAVPLGAVATVAASWALLRRSGLRLARR
jgi:ABC-type lipoprotein release transport system permease subunit